MRTLHPKPYTLNPTQGLTLVEMVVTVAIFAIISTVVIARNAQFDDEVLLNNLAYDIALSVRQAQQYGINVRVSEGISDRPYGIYFEDQSTTYILFIDSDNDLTYDAPDEMLQTFTIGRGATVGDLCDAESGNCNLDNLTIVFRRPEPDAIIDGGAIPRGRIEITSARTTGRRWILVESTGQIAIERPEEEE